MAAESMVRKGGGSVDPNDGLLVASVAVDGLRRSSWLAVDQRVDGAMGLVDRHVHRGRVALQMVQSRFHYHSLLNPRQHFKDFT